jgi:hypothetical protein
VPGAPATDFTRHSLVYLTWFASGRPRGLLDASTTTQYSRISTPDETLNQPCLTRAKSAPVQARIVRFQAVNCGFAAPHSRSY